ncbi:kinase-like protein [Serendipita vermifera]|nr:kinase-like protein [Serendipita vermifera]
MSTSNGFVPSTPVTTPSLFLDAYEPIDVIGNGSFGVIRKVRRKEDGAIFARKELNFERMSDRDKKQIVAEVNILKDLNHENIVRYHDRSVDSDHGMLYIVMEYCGGGDLAGVISSTKKRGQSIPEDTVWDYFLQIVLALHHCHSPHIKPGSNNEVLPNVPKRAPILHRDIKPENVFLDSNGVVKLGDFGLSKQLGAQAFTNTYVGTPYYMSPELFGEMHYDSKSDIWSLGCLVYELCALNPPFHEAQTHAELASYVKKGRIPTLPSQYGHYLQSAIKAMMSIDVSIIHLYILELADVPSACKASLRCQSPGTRAYEPCLQDPGNTGDAQQGGDSSTNFTGPRRAVGKEGTRVCPKRTRDDPARTRDSAPRTRIPCDSSKQGDRDPWSDCGEGGGNETMGI